MKKIISIFLCMILVSTTFLGCNSIKNTEDKVSEEDSVSADLFENNAEESDLGSIGFGVDLNDVTQLPVFEYLGGELKIPYYVIGASEKVVSKFGLMVFVDGISQPYKIEKSQDNITEDKYIHDFALKYEEKETFNIVFEPVTGKQGDSLGISFATILRPDYLPESVENFTSYGIYNSLSANIPMTIQYNNSIEDKNIFNDNNRIIYGEISKEIREFYNQSSIEGTGDYFDKNVISDILSNSDKKELIHFQKDNKLKVQFRIYGGIETNYRTTIFINHQPVKVSGNDYIEVKTKKNNMAIVDLELDTEQLNELNTIYAISIPYGKDYLNDVNYPVKSTSQLLSEK